MKPFSIKYLSWILAVAFLVACGGKEPIDPTPPTPPTPTIDTKAPVISVSLSSVNVIGGQEVTLGTSELKIGTKTVATWKDDVSKTCKTGLELDGKAISSGTKLSEPGKLKLTVTDEAGNSSSTEITLTKTDSQAPEIEVKIPEKNVIAGVKVKIEGNQLLFDSEVAASWIDDYSESCKVEITMDPEEGESKAVNSGDVFKEAGKLVILVQDDFENKSKAEITLTKTDSQAPTIEVKIPEKNVVAGVKVNVDGNQLLFNQDIAASWKDDYSETYTVELSIAGEKITSGDILFDAGTLVISVADEFQNKATAEITLTAIAVYGLENLQSKTFQIDQEVNLLEGISFAEGLTLQKVEMVQSNNHIQIENPRAFKPEYSGSIDIIFTLSRFDGSTIEVGVNNLTIKALDYSKVSIADMDPYDILLMYGIGRIKEGELNLYDYIDNLRIAEAMRIREMMGKYGAVSFNPEEYLQLMSRLNYVMLREVPDSDKYNNFEWIWESVEKSHSTKHHANDEMGIMTEFAGEYARLKVVGLPDSGEKNQFDILAEFVNNNPKSIYIVCASASEVLYSQDSFRNYLIRNKHIIIDAAYLSNVVFFYAWGDTITKNWIKYYKVYNGEYECDELGIYIYASMANSDKNNYPNSHLLVTTGTNPKWHADITNGSGSLFPVGFADDVLFAGFAFPYYNWGFSCFFGDPVSHHWGGWDASYTNYINGCVLGLMFQLHADLESVDPLIEMARSTSLENSISLNGQTQKLQRLNPAGYFTKYCMTTGIPSSMALDETVSLNKEWYKGLIFNIPGAEVNIGDEWIPFTAENASRIKAANPMNLEWRLNGALLRKYGYTPGQTLQGQIITVDDQWNGLRLEKDITIQIN